MRRKSLLALGMAGAVLLAPLFASAEIHSVDVTTTGYL